ncbi:MAG TPA: glycoside hydrolase family 2 TIM barrel-domain containing protein [Chitinophagaceae bacterium]|nr:glycoside hydrolase family 2 TIM barrel-domain containing protein [Chitinophagaceae bacterium]
MKRLWVFFCLCLPGIAGAQTDSLLAPQITDVPHRQVLNLDGQWHYIIDPYNTGYFDYRHHPTADGFFRNRHVSDPGQLIEYNFSTSPTLHVPGDWNTQSPELLYYEGTLWYERTFQFHPPPHKRIFLYFGAVNYHGVIGLNGKIIGEHIGGFTPFDMEVTHQLADGRNFIVAMTNNNRHKQGVPTNNFDWWNYGGITRDVYLITEPETFIEDYFIHLSDLQKHIISGWVKLNGPRADHRRVMVSIPSLKLNSPCMTDGDGKAYFSFQAPNLVLWSPRHPYLYPVSIKAGSDTLRDEVGFRTIAVQGTNILLNGKPIFLKGVCMHEEAPFGGGRAHSVEQDHILLKWAKNMGCNFVRLAHYPYNEAMIREAEKMGIMVWSEIPVYWTIDWDNPGTLENAKRQLKEEITRDKNRANIILWSMGNENPRLPERLVFMKALVSEARSLDPSRLITAALQVSGAHHDTTYLDDPLGADLDVIGGNIYPGWYGPPAGPTARFTMIYNKPLIMSEFGAGALQGFHGDTTTRWTEEFQYKVYEEDFALLKTIPFLRGICPWVLKDCRSPKRLLPFIQDGWNRKGLISDQGIPKEAYYLVKQYYSGKTW